MAFAAFWLLGAAAHNDWYCHWGSPSAPDRAQACATITPLVIAGSVMSIASVAILIWQIVRSRARRADAA